MLNKKIKYLIVSIFLFMMFTSNAYAGNIVDFSKKGSIEITLQENKENTGIPGAEVTIYKIADATSKNYNLAFEYVEELKDCDVSLENLEETTLSEEISKCIKEDTPSVIKTTNESGYVKFSNLELGLYLVTQSNKVEGYSKFDSFLAATPKTEENKWIYDIKATPKTDIYRVIDLTVIKTWNTGKDIEKLPEKVTIELYKGEELIDTVILNKENNWRHTWKDIEKSDKYIVKEIDIPEGYTPSYKNQEFVYTVTNSDTLPNTGQTHYPIIILTIAGMGFIFMGFIEQRKGN